MMKLFYSAGACSLAPHIILEELGLPFELVSVDFANPSAEFIKLNALKVVPVLLMDNKEPLTEGSAIQQYLADLKPEAGLAPKQGTMERYRLQEWLNFIATAIHKGFTPLFAAKFSTADSSIRDAIRQGGIESLAEALDVTAERLGSRQFLMPSGYTIADAYLFTVLSWSKFLEFDLSRWPSLQAHMGRIGARPATQRALKAEGLI